MHSAERARVVQGHTPSALRRSVLRRLARRAGALGAAPSRAAVARAVGGAFGGRLEVTADHTSAGRAVPAIQVGILRVDVCVLGQVGESGVRTAFAAPVAGRCLIGPPAVLGAG